MELEKRNLFFHTRNVQNNLKTSANRKQFERNLGAVRGGFGAKLFYLCAMKADELRIGNIVGLKGHTLDDNQIVHHEIFQVSIASLCEDGTVELKCVVNGKELRALHKETELVSIPLSEELILRCGFCYNDDYCCYEQNFMQIAKLEDGYYFTSYDEVRLENRPISNITFAFLHQLQNLYFALTGKELKVNV